ncbi:MAG TPA: hypothetical protein VFQ45_17160 [Longimicrobium sp.]|nr:hypothetical protein [Longimicrobium sp.]
MSTESTAMATGTPHRTREELEAGLDHVRAAPADHGPVRLIVRRPAVGEREVLEQAELDTAVGLVGDTWSVRASSRTADGSPHPDMQLTLMGTRVVALVAGHPDRWPLAGDQLYVDLDLSEANLPAGTRLALGTAIIELTPQPHTGCRKFIDRFGSEAMKFVNSPEGRTLRLRGANARVVRPGVVRVGDVARRLSADGAEP